jgi:radical SAM-linked protein
MRFASHRDIARAVERGVRKAGLPVAYSAGFSPHPKISYSGGAPTGAASEAEFLEISLTRICDPADVRERLDAALPTGIDVIEVMDLAHSAEGLRLEASHWKVVLPGVPPAEADRAVQEFLAAAHADVERLTSKGTRQLDARAAVLTMELDRRAMHDQDAGCAILRMVVRHMTPAVRPDDILVALRRMSALAPSSPPLVTRLAQGPLGLTETAASPWGASQGLGEGADQGQEKATRLDAESAGLTRTAPESANELLPRGAGRPAMADSAREPDGRDCPHARDRARQQGST